MPALLEDQYRVPGLTQAPRRGAGAGARSHDDHRLLGHRAFLSAGRNLKAASAALTLRAGVAGCGSSLLTCSGVKPRGWVSPGQWLTVHPTRLRLPPYSGGPYVASSTSERAAPTKSWTAESVWSERMRSCAGSGSAAKSPP